MLNTITSQWKQATVCLYHISGMFCNLNNINISYVQCLTGFENKPLFFQQFAFYFPINSDQNPKVIGLNPTLLRVFLSPFRPISLPGAFAHMG